MNSIVLILIVLVGILINRKCCLGVMCKINKLLVFFEVWL